MSSRLRLGLVGSSVFCAYALVTQEIFSLVVSVVLQLAFALVLARVVHVLSVRRILGTMIIGSGVALGIGAMILLRAHWPHPLAVPVLAGGVALLGIGVLIRGRTQPVTG